jgi:ABC-type multidrug transport system ATPase subunit
MIKEKNMENIILKTTDLTKKYNNKVVVDNLNIEIRKGEIFGLLGPNGAGKSTTMNMICSLVRPTAGEIELMGKNVMKQKKDVIHKIGYIPQELAEEDDVKHILSVMDIKKMIPVVDGVYSRVNINPEDKDTDEVKKYKDLLNKEYSFCLKIIDEVIVKANKLYDKQMATGKVIKFCCDFKVLEEVEINRSV